MFTSLSYLRKAFEQARVAFAGVHLQECFHWGVSSYAYDNCQTLADGLRENTRVIWVQGAKSPLYKITPDPLDHHRIGTRYEGLLKKERAEGHDVILIGGVWAKGCVKTFIERSVQPLGLLPVVVVDAVDLVYVRPGQPFKYTADQLKCIAAETYGHTNAMFCTTAEILACRPAGLNPL